MMSYILYCQRWSIRQSGVVESEGKLCSLHIDIRSLHEFIRQYWEKLPEPLPADFPHPTENSMHIKVPAFICHVDHDSYRRVEESGLGLWSKTVPRQEPSIVSVLPDKAFVSLDEGLGQWR